MSESVCHLLAKINVIGTDTLYYVSRSGTEVGDLVCCRCNDINMEFKAAAWLDLSKTSQTLLLLLELTSKPGVKSIPLLSTVDQELEILL